MMHQNVSQSSPEMKRKSANRTLARLRNAAPWALAVHRAMTIERSGELAADLEANPSAQATAVQHCDLHLTD
jgi:hypothetical protein